MKPLDLETYYKFDEAEGSVLIDSSGNGRNGTILGGAWSSRLEATINEIPINSSQDFYTISGTELILGLNADTNCTTDTITINSENIIIPTNDFYSNHIISTVTGTNKK